ncbi:hypothetical protein B0H16DRAFT_1492647 [Mycena metata]|uniref:Uncharacterized protein n=1 Tax=Mycena metata TaxID=1033252 RepID=A0AAD7KFB6_9AGAR|nr:hypothetical protein B0H16DRAFT_1492647 [Mycena metata]
MSSQSRRFCCAGGRDNHGNPVAIANATSITYDLCLHACGSGSAPFSWSAFSQQFSAWLLPWLALLSQFPFGSRYKWDNLMSAILALGSPCLATYSLTLTVLNKNWLTRRFASIKYPNSRYAALVLSSLQQIPLKVTTEGGLLASLVVLPENDSWWTDLVDRLDYADLNTWSIAAATSIAWVVISYLVTIVDAFTSISSDPNNDLQAFAGAGSVWLWMIPLTITYLQTSPRCDSERVPTALNRANEITFVAGPNGVVKAEQVNEMRALSLHPERQSLYSDQEATAPIYAYARFFSFGKVVEEFVSAFEYANQNSKARQPVDPTAIWEPGDGKSVDAANRRGTADQVEAYCSAPAYVRRSHWGPDALSRFCIASLAALALQWSTTGASVVIVYFTPTIGVGCGSLTFLIYGAVATLIWATLVLSSILTHYASYHEFRSFSHRAAAYASVFLRRLAKFLATLNAALIIGVFLLRFGNFFNRCYCNSNVISLGKMAHDVIVLGAGDLTAMRTSWTGGVALAVVSCVFYLGFINILT